MTKQEILDNLTTSDYGSIKSATEEVYLSYGGLARALYPDVEWFFDQQEGSYTGDWYMVGKDEKGQYYFFSQSYGSCSGCDDLEHALYDTLDVAKKEIGEIIDEILKTPILPNKKAALEYAQKFDWHNQYDRDQHTPLVKEVLEAIEKN